jgi:hypothetical protein
VGNDAHSHELLAVVAAVHHEGVCQALDDGALGLAEALDGISTGGVWDVDGLADLDVVAVVSMPLAIALVSCVPFHCLSSGCPERSGAMTYVREMSLISTSS